MIKDCLTVKKDTFKRAPQEVKSDLLYDCLNEIYGKVAGIEEKQQHRTKVDTAVSGTMGLVGGFLAFFSTKLFKGF